MDAVSVLRSRGVCLQSPDGTQTILAQWPAWLKSLPLLSPLLQPKTNPSVRRANTNFAVITHRATFEWGTHPSAIRRSAKFANGRFPQSRRAATGRTRPYDRGSTRLCAEDRMTRSSRLGFATFPQPMLSIPSSTHFFVQFLIVHTQECGHLGAVTAEENQFAMLPILPSRAVNTELASRLAGRPTMLAAHLE